MPIHDAMLQYCELHIELHAAGVLSSPVVPIEIGEALADCDPANEAYSLLSTNERLRIELEDQRSLNAAMARAIQRVYRLLHEDVTRPTVAGHLVEFLDAECGTAHDMLVRMERELEEARAEIASLKGILKYKVRIGSG